MSNNPLISVIIPAYNHEKYVQEAIQSIIHSSYENMELLVIDDGSKDSTWKKINEMKADCQKRFTNVLFETKPNGGTCETLNLLLEKSSGEYIFLIASDDMVKPQAIEKEVNFLNNNPDYALVVGDNELIDGESRICYWDSHNNNVYSKEKSRFNSFGQLLRHARKDVNFLSDDFGSYSSLVVGSYIPNGYLIRKSIFNIIGNFKKEAPLEDYWLMLQISKYAKMKYLDEILFSYRWHGANTASQSEKMKKIHIQTASYEIRLTRSLDFSKCLAGVEEAFHEGRIWKRQNFLGLVKTETRKTLLHNIKVIKILGIEVHRRIKARL